MKRCWYVPMKLGAYWKWFGAGSIDGLGMFSGMTTYSLTLSKENCWVRLLVIGKGWVLLHDIMEGRDYGQLKDLISDRSRWRQDSTWECVSETCWKQQKTKEERRVQSWYSVTTPSWQHTVIDVQFGVNSRDCQTCSMYRLLVCSCSCQWRTTDCTLLSDVHFCSFLLLQKDGSHLLPCTHGYIFLKRTAFAERPALKKRTTRCSLWDTFNSNDSDTIAMKFPADNHS